MIAKFLYHSEKMYIAKFRRDCKILPGLRNFRYGCKVFAILVKFLLCHNENPALPAFSSTSIQPLFLQFLMRLKVIHFQSIFLIDFYLKKTDLCAEMLNNTQNCYAAGNSRERGYCSKRSRNWLSRNDTTG